MNDRIPSLDGLRALSICCVLFAHLCGTRGFLPVASTRFTGDLGNLGVRIFFVISGFLITGLLLKEHRGGGISLKRFYLRRTLRIFPAAFLFIGVAACLFPLRSGDLAHALTYTSNYHPVHAWTMGHLWSLSVEEQFYLLWPAVVLLLAPVGAKWAALAAVVAAPLLRTVAYFHLGMSNEAVGEQFQFAMDAIAAGCLLALLRDRLAQIPGWLRILGDPIGCSCW